MLLVAVAFRLTMTTTGGGERRHSAAVAVLTWWRRIRKSSTFARYCFTHDLDDDTHTPQGTLLSTAETENDTPEKKKKTLQRHYPSGGSRIIVHLFWRTKQRNIFHLQCTMHHTLWNNGCFDQSGLPMEMVEMLDPSKSGEKYKTGTGFSGGRG